MYQVFLNGYTLRVSLKRCATKSPFLSHPSLETKKKPRDILQAEISVSLPRLVVLDLMWCQRRRMDAATLSRIQPRSPS